MATDSAERFECLLAALEQELIAATDEEILAAARDLGMNPAMRGSAAFFGITIPLRAPFRPGDRMESADEPSAGSRLEDDPLT